jgi:hypothetical protein
VAPRAASIRSRTSLSGCTGALTNGCERLSGHVLVVLGDAGLLRQHRSRECTPGALTARLRAGKLACQGGSVCRFCGQRKADQVF